MNRILAVVFTVILAVSSMTAQSNNNVYLIGSGLGSDIYAITNWGPFSSDSAAIVFSQSFPLGDYDSVEVFVRGSSTTGAAKWRGALYGGFGNTVSATLFDSLLIDIDTTSVKTEVLARIGKVATSGVAVGSVRVEGATENGNLHNPADAKVFVYLVCYRRPFTGNR